MASSDAFVAILYSHGRTGAPSFRLSRYFHARRKVSCTMSSASWNEPSIR